MNEFEEYQLEVSQGAVKMQGFETALAQKLVSDVDAGTLDSYKATQYILTYQTLYGVDLLDYM